MPHAFWSLAALILSGHLAASATASAPVAAAIPNTGEKSALNYQTFLEQTLKAPQLPFSESVLASRASTAPPTPTVILSYPSALAATQNSIDGLIQDIRGWSASRGLSAALAIQDKYTPMYNSVITLRTAAQSATDQEVDSQELTTLVNSIAVLIDMLEAKMSDFQQVGVQRISARDISDLEDPTSQIMTILLNVVSHDCAKLDRLRQPVSMLSSVFASAERAYTLTMEQMPTVPACSSHAANIDIPAEHQTPQPTILSSQIEDAVKVPNYMGGSHVSYATPATMRTTSVPEFTSNSLFTHRGPGPLVSSKGVTERATGAETYTSSSKTISALTTSTAAVTQSVSTASPSTARTGGESNSPWNFGDNPLQLVAAYDSSTNTTNAGVANAANASVADAANASVADAANASVANAANASDADAIADSSYPEGTFDSLGNATPSLANAASTTGVSLLLVCALLLL